MGGASGGAGPLPGWRGLYKKKGYLDLNATNWRNDRHSWRYKPLIDGAYIESMQKTPPPPWQGLPVEVKAEVLPRYFWTTASIDVYVGGSRVLRTGGRLALKGIQKATLKREGRDHEIELSWQSGFYLYYQLSIDGMPLAQSIVRPSNWPALYIPVAVFIAALFVASRLFPN